MSIKFYFFKKYLMIALIVVLFFLTKSAAGAAYNYFNDRLSYDVYFYNGDTNVSVIKDVNIVRIDDVAGKTFLVIKAAEFSLKDAEGFISYDDVIAVLPNQNYKIQTQQKIY